MAHDMSHSTPLISTGFLTKLTIITGILAAFTIGISVAGKWYGRKLLSGQYSESTSLKDVTIGPDRLLLPENTIRFPNQRKDGTVEEINLGVLWPKMAGFNHNNAERFFDTSSRSSMVFIDISQPTMTRDMSGRLKPIYSRLFTGSPEDGPGGLTLHRFRADSGYNGEVLLTGDNGGETPYAVRCILPATPSTATSADCQRDIHMGENLSVEYRFSSRLLKNWQGLDKAVEQFVADHLATKSAS